MRAHHLHLLGTCALWGATLTVSCSDLKSDENAPDLDASFNDSNPIDAGSEPDSSADGGSTSGDSIRSGGDTSLDAGPATGDSTVSDVDTSLDGRGEKNDDVQDVVNNERLDEAEACQPSCDHLGDFRCEPVAEASISRQVQVCSLLRGCLEWLDTALCKDSEVCCSGACQIIDAETSCLRPPPPPTTDFYVDAATGTDTADAGTDGGTVAHPSRSITHALELAKQAPAGARRIHIAAGTYDAAHGEAFPLVLRDGTSLYGAGSAVTTIRGSGSLDHSLLGGTLNQTYYPTILAGDDKFDTTVSGLTILGNSTAKAAHQYGILCDRGNAPSRGVSGGVTVLDGLTLGPGHETAVMVSGSSTPRDSGCNLRLTNSVVTGSAEGLVALGCSIGPGSNVVSMQIGDAGQGNSFTWNDTDVDDGHAMVIGPCVRNTEIRDNVFSDGGAGVTIDQSFEKSHGANTFFINHNWFTRLSWTGLFIFNNAPSIEEMQGNSFVDISNALTGRAGAAVALVLQGADGLYPPVKHARNNMFLGNDVGIVFNPSGTSVTLDSSSVLDFGTASDPGGNTFRCNSMYDGSAGTDVFVQLSGTGTLSMVGNYWDHVPMSSGLYGSPSTDNGVDLMYLDTGSMKPDTSQGATRSTSCPPGRVAGP